MQLLSDWENTRYGQIKFITENKEKQLEITAENFKKDSYRELRLKYEIESKKKINKKSFLKLFFLPQLISKIELHTSKTSIVNGLRNTKRK